MKQTVESFVKLLNLIGENIIVENLRNHFTPGYRCH